MAIDLVLLRHGQSEYNAHGQFTGWTDARLCEDGVREAHNAGVLLRDARIIFDVAHTSLLSRAIGTLNIVLEELNQSWVPVHKTWLLNERHYGALEGMSKAEAEELFGLDTVARWRRSYTERPPALTTTDERYIAIRTDPRYRTLRDDEIPRAESLEDTVSRMAPYFLADVRPALAQKNTVLVIAHGNVIRGIRKAVEGLSEQDVARLEIPTGIPYAYELAENLKPLRHYYLGDPERIAHATLTAAA
jgi:2,3-bisphosphoglycerate-dependent phosphoglycerate mutase